MMREPSMSEPAPSPDRASSATVWLGRNWWALCVFFGALVVRVHWNLAAHPIGDFMYSDMNGYDSRANAILDAPFAVNEYSTFFPYGTTWFVATLKAVFGRENFVAIGIVYALVGSCTALCTYLIARRISRPAWVAPAVGVLAVCYYPSIAVTGYILSEGPSSLTLTLATLLLLRLVDSGRARDAWMLGVTVAIGAAIRPQILMSGALFGLYWLVVRRHMPKVTWPRLVQIAIPIVIVLGFSAGRLRYHTGRAGLISENGRINQVFGHCHNKGIYSTPDQDGHGRVRFAPPPLIQLERWGHRNPDSWVQLDPVFGADPSPVDVPGFHVDRLGCRKRKCYVDGGEIQYRGYIGDREIQGQLVRECIRRSGLLKQAKYGLTHIVLLWGYNSMWPDQANPKPRAVDKLWRWRVMTDMWKDWHNWYLMPAALLGLAFVFFPRRHLGQAIVALNLWALLVVAVLYIGGIRFRIPYDPIIIVLASQTYAVIYEQIQKRRGKQPAATPPT
jgi:hypothetical protein